MQAEAGGEQRRDPRSCERHRVQTRSLVVGDLDQILQRLGRDAGRGPVRRDGCAVTPLVSILGLSELIERGGRDDHVDGRPRTNGSQQMGDRVDLCNDAGSGSEHLLEPGVDQRPVGSEGHRGRHLRPPREQDGLLRSLEDVDRGGGDRRDPLILAPQLELKGIDTRVDLIDTSGLGGIDPDLDFARRSGCQVGEHGDRFGGRREDRTLVECGLVLDARRHLGTQRPSDDGVGDGRPALVRDPERDAEQRFLGRGPRRLADQADQGRRRLLGPQGRRDPKDREEAQGEA